MNVDDIETEIPEPNFHFDRLDWIFKRQTDLMRKYHKIEVNNGFTVPQVPVNLDDKFGQAHLKDFAWRMTEELTEAMDTADPHHRREEITDAFHFLVELSIMVGMGPVLLFGNWIEQNNLEDHHKKKCRLERIIRYHGNRIPNIHPNLSTYSVIHHMGCAMNCLKNKPWKQSHHVTDRDFFLLNLIKAYEAFFDLICHSQFKDAQHFFEKKKKKSAVNKFRQRSNY